VTPHSLANDDAQPCRNAVVEVLYAKELANRYDERREEFHACDVSQCGWRAAVVTMSPRIDDF
jgi:hypothetical protein